MTIELGTKDDLESLHEHLLEQHREMPDKMKKFLKPIRIHLAVDCLTNGLNQRQMAEIVFADKPRKKRYANMRAFWSDNKAKILRLK